MSDLADLEQRLKSEVSALTEVGSAADLAAIKHKPVRTPAAYVMPERETASPNSAAAGGHIQRVVTTVAVALAHRDYKDARGGSASKDMEALKNAVLAKIVGWDGWSYLGSRLLGLLDGIVWEQLSFSRERQLRVLN